jgi:hypothetical protein
MYDSVKHTHATFSQSAGLKSTSTISLLFRKQAELINIQHLILCLLNAPYQFKPLNLRLLIFSLTLFGWFISISLFSYGNIIFYLCLSDLDPLFQEHN